MKSFKVTLVSRDDNKFEYTCYTTDVNSAIEEALGIVERNGWNQYEYKFYKVEEL